MHSFYSFFVHSLARRESAAAFKCVSLTLTHYLVITKCISTVFLHKHVSLVQHFCFIVTTVQLPLKAPSFICYPAIYYAILRCSTLVLLNSIPIMSFFICFRCQCIRMVAMFTGSFAQSRSILCFEAACIFYGVHVLFTCLTLISLPPSAYLLVCCCFYIKFVIEFAVTAALGVFAYDRPMVYDPVVFTGRRRSDKSVRCTYELAFFVLNCKDSGSMLVVRI